MFVKVTHETSLETKLSAMMGHVTTFESGPIRLNFDEEGVVLWQHLSLKKGPSVRQVQRFQRSELIVHCNVCKKSPAEC